MSTAPSVQDIRAAIEAARALDGREDTEHFALTAPGLLARLVQILDLYVGHEPTLAEEEAYVRSKHRAEVLAEAADTIDRTPSISAAVHATAELRRMAASGQAGKDTREGESTQPAPHFFQPGRTYTDGNGYRAPELTAYFRVEHVTRHPDRGTLRAIGWMRNGTPGAGWHGDFRDEDQTEGWTEVTEDGGR